MKQIKKKVIRQTIEEALAVALGHLEIKDPSKKTRKTIHEVSKKVMKGVKRELKLKLRAADKATKAVKGPKVKEAKPKKSEAKNEKIKISAA